MSVYPKLRLVKLIKNTFWRLLEDMCLVFSTEEHPRADINLYFAYSKIVDAFIFCFFLNIFCVSVSV